MKKLSIVLLVLMAAFISQCKKENPHVWNDPIPPGGGGGTVGNGILYSINKGAAVTINASGIIQDEQGNPIAGAKVTLGSQTYTSNELGQVFIENGPAFKEIAFFKAEKAGYFTGSRSIIPQAGLNQFVIRLMAKGSPQTFQANTEAHLVNGEVHVDFDGTVVDQSGKAYNGKVNAYVRHLDPEDANITEIMPGSMRGADADGEKILETYGMVAVELEAENGQKLQLAKDHPATIMMDVPPSMLANAPAKMPLWHFDEVNGIWSHDGEGTLQNGKYVGKVSHFSFWNYDIPN
ncbi:MAG: hypothetical protein LPK45_06220, partial [Bacteroidota bacterium]|nr:hypothetical protein [Bacteroidota bacterium]MDX5430668.1 hypothetical protein [Bacteroidota bacterium]MDX5469415.1 hypothetical protein [Bacteroidota bacterium]